MQESYLSVSEILRKVFNVYLLKTSSEFNSTKLFILVLLFSANKDSMQLQNSLSKLIPGRIVRDDDVQIACGGCLGAEDNS